MNYGDLFTTSDATIGATAVIDGSVMIPDIEIALSKIGWSLTPSFSNMSIRTLRGPESTFNQLLKVKGLSNIEQNYAMNIQPYIPKLPAGTYGPELPPAQQKPQTKEGSMLSIALLAIAGIGLLVAIKA